MYANLRFSTITLIPFLAATLAASPVTLFSTGNPNGLIATVSGPASGSLAETETADDFILGQNALVSGATFTGLLPSGASLSAIKDVEIELYRVFPLDSVNPPDGRVPTRVNSPSDNQFAAFDEATGGIGVTASILNPSFTAANSVINGINPIPNQNTRGEGPVTGEEVLFSIVFNTPFVVGAADHDFFRPEVELSSGNFLWLSAPKPIMPPGTPFTGDLQAWIRNTNLDPDWLRIGTDIVGGAPAPTYNMTFSLAGTAIPEPSSMLLLGTGLAAALALGRKKRRAS
ncbi:MAG: PEP-CTERM sorting domain-containing protein [Bryobacteraceae bacterium]